MSVAVCDWCEAYVEASNLRWPGYCSPTCRDAHRAHRQARAPRRGPRDARSMPVRVGDELTR